ncbi:hypothetical protein AXF42_Ash006480 [Apostasia shenzhenica]|uniref:Uncharacterized protein n=1 Tax=Apostasia shenzhenica TaxID=1088818 RepID=A0A2I0AZ92_9ASPA|nr:hypothetical protein AXF42_Ash006480 [Apostasia shenzhenica]
MEAEGSTFKKEKDPFRNNQQVHRCLPFWSLPRRTSEKKDRIPQDRERIHRRASRGKQCLDESSCRKKRGGAETPINGDKNQSTELSAFTN